MLNLHDCKNSNSVLQRYKEKKRDYREGKEEMTDIPVYVMPDNNENQFMTFVAILAIVFIVTTMIEIFIKIKRKEHLQEVKKKLVKRHSQMETELGGF